MPDVKECPHCGHNVIVDEVSCGAGDEVRPIFRCMNCGLVAYFDLTDLVGNKVFQFTKMHIMLNGINEVWSLTALGILTSVCRVHFAVTGLFILIGLLMRMVLNQRPFIVLIALVVGLRFISTIWARKS